MTTPRTADVMAEKMAARRTPPPPAPVPPRTPPAPASDERRVRRNVDLTAELVAMITAQRDYQANAQTIKTMDQALQTLVNLR